MRLPRLALGVAGLVLMGASPAAPPDFPVSYVSVDELKNLLDQSARVDIIDVRTRGEYDALHIKGARSIPLRTVRERASGIPRAGLVVFY